MTVQGGGSLRDVFAVKSGDFQEVYFVAGDLQGPGLDGDNDIALWATNSTSTTGLGAIFSIDAVANEFSDWTDGGKSSAELSMSDDGAAEAKKCATR